MAIGTQIGSYQIERELGHGGFGVVYVGIDTRLGRRAAIKQLLPELSTNHEIVERFFNEAKAAANINHPGIVEIYDVGWHTDGSAYFAMKLLEGDSLARRLKRTGPLPIALACTIARQVASALVAAHARGIVHRDLKPDNIVLVPDDEVAIGERATVLDFGIAKLFGDKPLSQKTRTGMMMGTPSYMSPEQCRGAGEVDHRTDVYALGCIVFEMLTGRAPFVGEGAGEVLGMHQFVEPPTVRSLRGDVPPDLEALVMRTLAKKPDQRHQQMSELVTALGTFATGGRASAERSAHMPAASAALPQQVTPPPELTPPHLLHAAQNVTTDRAQPSTFTAARGEIGVPAAKKSSKLPLAIAGGVLGIGAIIAVVVVATRTPAATKAPAADAAVAQADAAVADAAVVAETPITVDAAPVRDGDLAAGATADLTRACEKAVADKKWADLSDCAKKLESVDPAKAKAFGNTARVEAAAEVAAREVEQHLKDANLKNARVAFQKIPDTSVYFKDAKARITKAEQTVIADLVADLRRYAQARDCAKYKAKLRSAETMHGKIVADAGRASVRCEQNETVGTQACQPPEKADPFNPLPICKPAANPCAACKSDEKCVNNKCVANAKPACDAAKFDELVRGGDDMVPLGNHAAALQKYLAALACKMDGNVLAKAFISACNARDAGVAKRLYKSLPPARQAMMSQACLRNGIVLE